MSESIPARIIVGVGAIITEGDRILLIQRGHAPSAGAWTIPGGRVELGETLVQAVIREIEEECNLTIDVGDVAIMLDRVSREPDGTIRSHYLIVDFWAESAAGVAAAGDDAADLGWYTLDEIRHLPTTANLPRYLEEALQRRSSRTPGCLVVGD